MRGPAADVAERFREAPKGEVTLVLGAAAATSRPDAGDAIAAVAELVGAGLPRRRAADLVARLTGAPRNKLYRDSLGTPTRRPT